MTQTSTPAANAPIVPIGHTADGTPYYYADTVCDSCGVAYGYGCC